MIKVVLVDDHVVVRSGFAQLLNLEEDVIVEGQFSSAAEAWPALSRNDIDVAVMDVAMPDENGLSLLKRLRQQRPTFRAIILSIYDTPAFVQSALDAGASGYLTKRCGPEELVQAVRAVGMGMAMQGSGISGMDVGSATLKLNDDGFYSLIIGAADMGTGCDTTLAQIAAEVLDCPLDNIAVFGADTDTSPYDSGSYASSTTYVTGKATEKCAMKLREQICKLGAELLGCPADAVEFDGKEVFESAAPETKKTLSEIAYASQFGHMVPLEATETHTSPLSPPPYMVGAAEVEVDTETGEVKVLEFDACVDCGTPINPNLTRVQAEGGLLQGIGMTLTENVTYDRKGCPEENSLFQYKIPTRIDIGKINVEFENSYEPNGPFGAKSIGEVVINTPLPAISDAIYNAIGTRFYELPITPEQIAMAAAENHK